MHTVFAPAEYAKYILRFSIVLAAVLGLAGCNDRLLPGDSAQNGSAGAIVYNDVGQPATLYRDSRLFSVQPDGSRRQMLAENMLVVAVAGSRVVALSGKDQNIIHVADIRGSRLADLKTITVPAEVRIAPRTVAISPRGDRIVYMTVGATRSTIMADPDGSNPVRLPLAIAEQATPAFSPDGKRLAFVSAGTDAIPARDLYVVDSDGSGLELVIPIPVVSDRTISSIDWSPDGKKLVVTSAFNEYMQALFLVDVATKEWEHIGGGLAPRWSPDGRKIAYTYAATVGRDRELYIADVDSLYRPRAVTQSAVDQASQNLCPRWSPDGKKILYIHVPETPGEAPGTLMILDLESGNEVPLAEDVYLGFWTR